MYIFENSDEDYQRSVYAPSRKAVAKVEVVGGSDEPVGEDTVTEGTGTPVYRYDDALVSLEIERTFPESGRLAGGALSKKYTVRILDTENAVTFPGKRIRPYLGFEAEGTEVFVPFPEADIYDSEYDSVAGVWTLTCYDDMQKLERTKIRDIVFPSQQLTLYQYAAAVCAHAGLEIENEEIFNGDMSFPVNDPSGNVIVPGAPNLSGDEDLRQVLSAVAEASLSSAVIGRSGKVRFVPVTGLLEEDPTGGPYTLSDEKYFSLEMKGSFGPVNRVVLSRTGEDDVFSPSETDGAPVYIGGTSIDDHIAAFGVNELRITDNPFLDRYFASEDQRAEYASRLLEKIKGLTVYSYSLRYRGDPALDEGEIIKLIPPGGGREFRTYLFSDVLRYTGGLSSEAGGGYTQTQENDYRRASSISERLRITQLKVDKNEGAISGLVSSLTEREHSIEQLRNAISATRSDVNVVISKTGGSNLLRNSAFYNGISCWDAEGADFRIDVSEEMAGRSLTGSKLVLMSGSISQEFTAVLNETYTFACLYRNAGTIPGRVSEIMISFGEGNGITVPGSTEISADWKEIELTFTVRNTYTPRLTISTDNGNSDMEVSDLRIIRGSVRQPWSQHSSETSGKRHSLDDSGLSIRSLAGEEESVAIDNDSMLIKRGSATVCEFSDERCLSPRGEFTEGMSVGGAEFIHVGPGRIFIAKGEQNA
ncbi:MAG: hypothetical protein IKD81_02865 [Eubacteriaceae bacterium]|nr:hypothetical protein [Eubacteriaceae bacterium]